MWKAGLAASPPGVHRTVGASRTVNNALLLSGGGDDFKLTARTIIQVLKNLNNVNMILQLKIDRYLLKSLKNSPKQNIIFLYGGAHLCLLLEAGGRLGGHHIHNGRRHSGLG